MWLVGWLGCTPSSTDGPSPPVHSDETADTAHTGSTGHTGEPPGPCERPPVITGDIDAATAAALCAEHDDLSLSGNLHLEDVDEVSLPCVCDLGGNLVVRGVRSLDLPRLRGTAGQILVEASPELEVLDLPALTDVGRNLVLVGLPGLTRVSAPALRKVDGEVRVEQDPLLAELTLTSLDRVEDEVVLDGLPRLATLDGLAALRSVEWGIRVAGTGVVTARLPALELCGATLELEDDLELQRIEAFPALQDLGELSVTGAPRLTSITGFPAHATIWSLRLEDDPLLATVELPGQVTTGTIVQRHVPRLAHAPTLVGASDAYQVVLEDTGLVDATDLAALRRTSVNLEIDQNARLVDISALADLERVGGNLYVRDNPRLPQLQAQALAATVEVGGVVKVSGNGG